MHAADGKAKDKHRREAMQVPQWNAIDELPENILTPSREDLLKSVKKRSVKTPKLKSAQKPDLFKDDAFLAGLYSSPLDFGAKEFEVL